LWSILALVVSIVLAVGIEVITTDVPGPLPPSASAPPPVPPVPTLHVHTRVSLVWALDSLHVINADTGEGLTLPMPAPEGMSGDGMVVAHGSLILNRGEKTWLYPPGFARPPVDLGTSARTIVTPSGNGVWLWDTGPFNDPGTMDVMRQVDFTGHQVSPTVPVGTDWFPTGEVVDQGLVFIPRFGGPIDIWDPASRKVLTKFGDGTAEIAASGHEFAWVNAGCLSHCVVHVTDVRTETEGFRISKERVFALPPGVWPIERGGVFSPDGATLAVSALLGRFLRGGHPASERFVQTAEVVVVVDIASGTARVLPGSKRSSTFQRALPLIWSPNDWLFFTDYGSPYVEAWHPGLRTAGVLPNVRLPHLPPPGPRGQRLPSLIAVASGEWVATSPASHFSR
jgi:hypothetical protein